MTDRQVFTENDFLKTKKPYEYLQSLKGTWQFEKACRDLEENAVALGIGMHDFQDFCNMFLPGLFPPENERVPKGFRFSKNDFLNTLTPYEYLRSLKGDPQFGQAYEDVKANAAAVGIRTFNELCRVFMPDL